MFHVQLGCLMSETSEHLKSHFFKPIKSFYIPLKPSENSSTSFKMLVSLLPLIFSIFFFGIRGQKGDRHDRHDRGDRGDRRRDRSRDRDRDRGGTRWRWVGSQMASFWLGKWWENDKENRDLGCFPLFPQDFQRK